MSDTVAPPLRIVVDTNVWVDSFCPSHAACAAARTFLRQAELHSVDLLYPVHAIKDILYVLGAEFRREVKAASNEPLTESQVLAARETALACTRAVMRSATAVGADVSDVWLADKYLPVHHDFEDNLVLVACRRSGAQYLVTSDRSLIAHANVVAKDPAEMARLLELGQA